MVKFLAGRTLSLLGALALAAVPMLHAADARFDLTGPPIDVRVTRAGMSLPIDSVPNLQPGDKLWLHPDLPSTQSVKYLLVVAFLRGTTNPPPDDWFTRIETWDKKVRAEGTTVVVPGEAQQVILFLAPATGGDFTTLRSAVQGRPGVFVRAAQDLVEAGFEQARIEKYISSMKQAPASDHKALLDHSNFLASTLNLKPNEECFKRPVDQQSTCLTQSGNQTLLDDGHGESIAATLATGSNADLITAASTTQLAGAGLYSAYVGAVVDLVRVLSGLHTAKYQYIPAIAFPQQASLNLRLNTPPSFHNPKSVIVIGLPAVLAITPPPLRTVNEKQSTCLLRPSAALLVDGAPLVFSTNYAHNLKLHLNTPQPTPDIPLTADAYQGGLVLTSDPKRRELPPSLTDEKPSMPSTPLAPSAAFQSDGLLTGTIIGYWGFDRFTGPTLPLQDAPGKNWRIDGDQPLIAGQDEHIEIVSTGTACVQSVVAETTPSRSIKAEWKPGDDPARLDVTLALRTASAPIPLKLYIRQFGDAHLETVSTQTFSEPAKLETLVFHAGDSTAMLRGAALDQVKQIELGGAVFVPQPDSPPGVLELKLASGAGTPRLHVGDKLMAKIALIDGRTLPLAATVAQPRPSLTLLDRSARQPDASPIQLVNKDDLPLTQPISFSLKSAMPFPRQEQIEIANMDGSLHAVLSIAAGSLLLQDPHTVLGNLDALKTFGGSAFGPLRLRAIAPDGTAGDWLPLATLVRLPTLGSLQCPGDGACALMGTNLYLIDAVSATPDMSNAFSVPEGFLGDSISVPYPENGTLYLRLRDDPTSANAVTLPIQTQP